MQTWLLYTLAIVFLILIPIAPQLVRLRIRFLKGLDWNWAANLLENRFQFWVLLKRIVLFLLAAALFYFGSLQ